MAVYIDPNLKDVFKNRLVFSLTNADKWDEDILPRQNKYVVFGQTGCNKLEIIEKLLCDEGIKYEINILEKEKSTFRFYNESTKVVIIVNGHLSTKTEGAIATFVLRS